MTFRRVIRGAAVAASFSCALMASEAQGATITKQYLSTSQAASIMQNEYSLSNGKVTRMRLGIQTLEQKGGKTAYLVVDVEKKELDALNKEIAGKPNPEQEVEKWIIKNEKTVIYTYFSRDRPSKIKLDLASSSGPGSGLKPSTRRAEGGSGGVATIKLPSQVKGGNGSEDNPFVVRPVVERGFVGTGGKKFFAPVKFEIEGLGRVYFKLDLTVNQVGQKPRTEVIAELSKIFRACFDAVKDEKFGESFPGNYSASVNEALKIIGRNLNLIGKKVSATDADIAEYLKKN